MAVSLCFYNQVFTVRLLGVCFWLTVQSGFQVGAQSDTFNDRLPKSENRSSTCNDAKKRASGHWGRTLFLVSALTYFTLRLVLAGATDVVLSRLRVLLAGFL